ncbi:MAG TPA: hypothetical protein VKN76_13195 [Kiloniellaceae bacterium]|nr:hypothetical protein [Kiloniellaceae bacterium]
MATYSPAKTDAKTEKPTLIKIAAAPLPARLITAEGTQNGYLLRAAAAGVVMHLEGPLPLDKRVALALPGSLYGGGRVQWRQGKRHGIAFDENRAELQGMLTRWQAAPQPGKDLP